MNELNVKIRGVQKSYNKPVLTNVNLDITNDSYYAIEGKSGTGKSTFMNILGLIENFDEGEYIFNGVEIKKNKDYSNIRLNNIGFIFQSYNLIPTMTAKENIMLPILYADNACVDIEELASDLDIYDLLDKDVNILSGGEKQRVAIARALVLNPSLIIADEPTGNLDEYNRQLVFELLKKEHNKGRGIVMITHDPSTALQAKKIYRLHQGELYEKDKFI